MKFGSLVTRNSRPVRFRDRLLVLGEDFEQLGSVVESSVSGTSTNCHITGSLRMGTYVSSAPLTAILLREQLRPEAQSRTFLIVPIYEKLCQLVCTCRLAHSSLSYITQRFSRPRLPRLPSSPFSSPASRVCKCDTLSPSL